MPPYRHPRRYWQVSVSWPAGAVMTFGVTGRDTAAARARARARLAGLPGGGTVTVTRIYRAAARARPGARP